LDAGDGEQPRIDIITAMLGASGLITILTLVNNVIAKPSTFSESLTLHPLPDGKLSVLFEFTTHFAKSPNDGELRPMTKSHGSRLASHSDPTFSLAAFGAQ